MRHNIACGFIILACVALLVSVGYVCLERDIETMAKFKAAATEKLGTGNFEIYSSDGYLQAITSDGAKYPTDAEMHQYYEDKFFAQLEALGVLALAMIVILVVWGTIVYYSLSKKSCTAPSCIQKGE